MFRKLRAKYIKGDETSNISKLPLPSGEGPLCFVEFAVDGEDNGRIVVKLYKDKAPLACENFRCLCTGEITRQRRLCYLGSKVHRIVPNFCIQMGDFTRGDGRGGSSIYPPNSEHGDAWGKFKDEIFLQHSKPGLLSMANSGPNTNSSQVFFTLKQVPYLDGKHVVFGEVVEGMDVLETLGNLSTDKKTQAPVQHVTISSCGVIVEGKDAPCLANDKGGNTGPFGFSGLSTGGSTNTSSKPSLFGTSSPFTSGQTTPFTFGVSAASSSPASSLGSGASSSKPSLFNNSSPSPFTFGATKTGAGTSASQPSLFNSNPQSPFTFGASATTDANASSSNPSN